MGEAIGQVSDPSPARAAATSATPLSALTISATTGTNASVQKTAVRQRADEQCPIGDCRFGWPFLADCWRSRPAETTLK